MSEAQLSKTDIEHLAQALRKLGRAIEVNIPNFTNTTFRAQVRGEFVPFGEADAEAIEAIFGEPLCVVQCVVPYAFPLSIALKYMPDYEWKRAVQAGQTILGRDEWNKQYLLDHTVKKILAQAATKDTNGS